MGELKDFNGTGISVLVLKVLEGIGSCNDGSEVACTEMMAIET